MNSNSAQNPLRWLKSGSGRRLPIPEAIILYFGVAVVIKMPQGSGLPADPMFWLPSVPILGMAVVAYVVSRLFKDGSYWKRWFSISSTMLGAISISFAMMLFADADRPDIDAFAQAPVVSGSN